MRNSKWKSAVGFPRDRSADGGRAYLRGYNEAPVKSLNKATFYSLRYPVTSSIIYFLLGLSLAARLARTNCD